MKALLSRTELSYRKMVVRGRVELPTFALRERYSAVLKYRTINCRRQEPLHAKLPKDIFIWNDPS